MTSAAASAQRSANLRRACLAAVCAGLLALAGLRGVALAAALARGHGDAAGLLTARDERRWHGWAQRHPRMNAAFAAAADRLPASARIVWVVPPGVQPRWVEIMALYHLPSSWTVAVRNRGGGEPGAAPRAGAAEAATWRVDVYADGRVAVRSLQPR